MVAPIITKPRVYEGLNADVAGSHFDATIRSVQGQPYNLPSPYDKQRCETHSAVKFGSTTTFGGMANAWATKSYFQPGGLNYFSNKFAGELADAKNAAAEAFMGKLGEESMLLVNIIQRQQSFDMIRDRAVSLLRFARALKRGDISQAFRLLALGGKRATPKGWREKSKTFADLWLELHFGWSPLCQDIYNTVEAIGARNQETFSRHIKVKGKKISLNKNSYQKISGTESDFIRYSIAGYIRGSCSAVLTVDNPNAALAQRLGLVNPASVAWELIPFSFVVDWFSNVGAFLGQYSSLVGMTLSNPSSSWVGSVTSAEVESATYATTPDKTRSGYHITSSCFQCNRSLGMPSVTLKIRPFKRVSAVRAATSISLLVQFLRTNAGAIVKKH